MCSTVLLIPGITSFLTEHFKLKTQLKSTSVNLKDQTYDHGMFARFFVDTLVDLFRNGNGRSFVHDYLKELTKCIIHLENGEDFPALNVRHVSSATNYYKFSVTTSISPPQSVSTPRLNLPGCESEELPSPCSSKSWKGSFVSSTPSRGQKRKADVMSPPSPTPSIEMLGNDYFKKKNCYCDLVVTSVDRDNLPKYILLVEVLSRGTSIDSCINKMQDELMCTLQIQDMCYGVIFAPEEFVIVSAGLKNPNPTQHDQTKKEGHGDQETHAGVTLGENRYVMYTEGYLFYVKRFQEFTMDLFSIMLHGVMSDQLHDL